MAYLQNNEIKEEMKEILNDKLSDYEGTTCYACDLGYKLFETENYNGSYTCNSYEAKEWIKENFEYLGEIVEKIKSQLGAESIPNVFDNPETFQLVIFLEVSSYLIGQCEFINDNWDDEIELTEDNIKIIKEQLNNL